MHDTISGLRKEIAKSRQSDCDAFANTAKAEALVRNRDTRISELTDALSIECKRVEDFSVENKTQTRDIV